MDSNKSTYPLDFTLVNGGKSFEMTLMYQPEYQVQKEVGLSFTDVVKKLSLETNIDFNLYMISEFHFRQGGGFTIDLRDEDVAPFRMYILCNIIEYED